jgi:hypothetical protein
MHLHNAGEALGLHNLRRDVNISRGGGILYTVTKTTTTTTKTIRKEVVDTAKAFVPVAVEIGVVDTLARYFN